MILGKAILGNTVDSRESKWVTKEINPEFSLEIQLCSKNCILDTLQKDLTLWRRGQGKGERKEKRTTRRKIDSFITVMSTPLKDLKKQVRDRSS